MLKGGGSDVTSMENTGDTYDGSMAQLVTNLHTTSGLISTVKQQDRNWL